MSKRSAKPSPRPAVAARPDRDFTGGFPHPAAICLALVAATFAVYWPAHGFDFINYDDTDFIVKNWHVQTGLTWENVRWAFTTGYLGNWLPLSWLTHMLDVELFGKGAGGPHMVNVALHAANSALVYLWLRRMTGGAGRSLLVAALFALHPLRVESVAWVCERRDVLSSFFGLLALYFYAGHARTQTTPNARRVNRDYILALLFFTASLMSKPMQVTLPFALLLLDYWPLQRFDLSTRNAQPRLRAGGQPSTFLRLLPEKIPFFALAGFFAGLTMELQKAAGAVNPLAGLPLQFRVENAVVSYARYLGKVVWPADLVLPYLRTERWPVWEVGLSALLLAGLCGLAVVVGRKFRFVATGWFWFFGMLVPVIGLVQAGAQAMADRFVYLPAIGVLVIVVWGLAEVFRRWPVPKAVLFGGAGAVLAALSLRTADQLQYWRNSETLFRHTLTVEPHNFAALNNLGVYCAERGRADEAIAYYRRALESNPDHAQTLINLGNALAARKQYAEAIEAYQHSLRIMSDQPEAYVNLGNAYAATGRLDEAMEQFHTALRLRPDYPDACNNLGNVLMLKGSFSEGVALLRQAVRFRPEDADSHFNLGNALALSGQMEEACAEFRTALRLQPDHVRAWNNLGLALLQTGKTAEAVAELQRGLQIDPGSAELNFTLGSALAKMGRRDEAVARLLQVLRLRPDHAEARRILHELGVNAPG